MDFVLFPDLYQDWKDIRYSKELFEAIYKELKQEKDGEQK